MPIQTGERMKSIRDQAAHFPELVGFYAQTQPDRIALRHIVHEDQPPLLTSYAQLDVVRDEIINSVPEEENERRAKAGLYKLARLLRLVTKAADAMTGRKGRRRLPEDVEQLALGL